MTIETTILDFQLSNTFEQYESHMNSEEQQSMFKEMGVKTFYIGKSIDDPITLNSKSTSSNFYIISGILIFNE